MDSHGFISERVPLKHKETIDLIDLPSKKMGGVPLQILRSDGLGDGIGRPHNGRDVDLPDVVQPFVGPTTKDHQARLLDGRRNL